VQSGEASGPEKAVARRPPSSQEIEASQEKKATQEIKSAFVALNEATCYGTLSQGRAAQEGTAHGHGNSFGSDKRACKLTGMTMLSLAPKG
jgi:hypothetical protein